MPASRGWAADVLRRFLAAHKDVQSQTLCGDGAALLQLSFERKGWQAQSTLGFRLVVSRPHLLAESMTAASPGTVGSDAAMYLTDGAPI